MIYSNFLSNIISTDILLTILISLIVLFIFALIRLEIKLRKLCRGSSGQDLEFVINSISEDIKKLERFEEESKSYFKNLEKRVRRGTQAVDVIKFNAFKGDGLGGNQSFATTILNENGDGAVISSLYTRERVSVFAKPIKSFQSEIELTEEEKEVLEKSKNRLI